MLKKALVTTLLTLSSAVHAAEPASTDLQQCAVDLCGPTRTYLAYRLNGPFGEAIPLSTKRFQQEVLDPILDRSFEKIRQTRRMEIEIAKDLLARQNEIDLSKTDTSLLILGLGRAIVEPFKKEVVQAMSDGKEWISLKKLIPLRPDLDPALLKQIIDARNIYLGTGQLDTAKLAEKSNLEQFVRAVFNRNRPSFQIKRDFLEGRLEIMAKEPRLVGRLAYAGLHTDLLLRDMEKQPYTAVEEAEVMALLAISYRFEALRTDFVQSKTSTVKLSAADLFRMIDLEKRIHTSEAREKERALTSPGFVEFRKACEIKAGKFLAAAPSDLRLRKSLELYEQVRASAKRVLPDFFQGAALQAALKTADAIRVETPPTQTTIESRLEGLLQGRLDVIARGTTSLSQARPEMTDAEKIYWLGLELNRPPDEKVDSEMQGICDSMRIPLFEDRAYLEEGELVIGWQSAIFPEVANGIMAHETGHLVSFAVRPFTEGKKAYDDKRYCSAVRAFYLSNKKLQTSLYEEEDWADDFSVAVRQDMKRNGNPIAETNYACGLLEVDKETRQFTNLTFDPPPADVHSTSLLRALRIHLGAGHAIPGSCQNALGSAFTSIEKRSCQ